MLTGECRRGRVRRQNRRKPGTRIEWWEDHEKKKDGRGEWNTEGKSKKGVGID